MPLLDLNTRKLIMQDGVKAAVDGGPRRAPAYSGPTRLRRAKRVVWLAGFDSFLNSEVKF